MSVNVGKIFEFVCLFVCLFACLFVRSITQKRIIPKCSNLVIGIISGYPKSAHGFGLTGQRSTLGLGLTAIWRGFELFECLLVLTFY